MCRFNSVKQNHKKEAQNKGHHRITYSGLSECEIIKIYFLESKNRDFYEINN